jgi:hypothetical protein
MPIEVLAHLPWYPFESMRTKGHSCDGLSNKVINRATGASDIHVCVNTDEPRPSSVNRTAK